MAETLSERWTRLMGKNRDQEQAVIDAARAFIREVDNPAPDLLWRAKLRDRLRAALDELDGRKRGNVEP